MPPLRECRDDVPDMAQNILARLAAQHGVPAPALSAPALAELMRYDFPGNVRELENLLERALALSSGSGAQLGPEDLALHRIAADEGELAAADAQAAKPGAGAQAPSGAGAPAEPLPAYLDRLERQAIL